MPNKLSENLTLRPTISGIGLDDDYQVIWRGMPVGRIMKINGAPVDGPQWSWGCTVPGRRLTGGDYGTGDSLDDCEAAFRIAWAQIRAGQRACGSTTGFEEDQGVRPSDGAM